MPRLFRAYTRVHMYFSAYAIKIMKKYIKIPYFRAGLMVTLVVQPRQHVANCFQLLKLLWGSIKAPHVYGLREREKLLILYSVGIPYPSLIPRASCTFPVHYRKPLFPWDTHPFICYLVCTSLEGVLARQGLDGSRRRSAKTLEGSSDLSTCYFCTCYL